jgi:hypothetical protein
VTHHTAPQPGNAFTRNLCIAMPDSLHWVCCSSRPQSAPPQQRGKGAGVSPATHERMHANVRLFLKPPYSLHCLALGLCMTSTTGRPAGPDAAPAQQLLLRAGSLAEGRLFPSHLLLCTGWACARDSLSLWLPSPLKTTLVLQVAIIMLAGHPSRQDCAPPTLHQTLAPGPTLVHPMPRGQPRPFLPSRVAPITLNEPPGRPRPFKHAPALTRPFLPALSGRRRLVPRAPVL